MKKMIKECTINLYVRKTNVLAEDSSYTQPYNVFYGDKNEIMRSNRIIRTLWGYSSVGRAQIC